MVNIFVARHGQDVDNANGILNGHRDQPLTDLGRHQATNVGNRMLDAGFSLLSSVSNHPTSDSGSTVISAIYSSPLKRALETAEIIAAVLSNSNNHDDNNHLVDTTRDTVKIKVLNDLIERDFGCMTGLPVSSIVERCHSQHVLCTENVNYFLEPEGAETFPDLVERAKKLLSTIQQQFPAGAGDEQSKIENAASHTPSILLVTHGDFGKMLYAAYYNLHWMEVLKQFYFGNSEVLLLSRDLSPDNAHVFKTVSGSQV